MKKIFLVEDEILVARNIERILNSNSYKVVGIATSYEEAKEKLKTTQPHLILCDINLNEEKNGIDLMSEIMPKYNIPFIYISAYSDLNIIKRAEKQGPINYITKPFNEKQLLVTINLFFSSNNKQGELVPTDKELAVLQLIGQGYSTKEVAEELSISFHTVESHRKNLIRKHKVSSITELICFAASKGWIKYIPS